MHWHWLLGLRSRGYLPFPLLPQSQMFRLFRGFHLHQQNRGYQHLPDCLAHQQSQRHLLFRCFRGCLLRQPGLQRMSHQPHPRHHCRLQQHLSRESLHYRGQ